MFPGARSQEETRLCSRRFVDSSSCHIWKTMGVACGIVVEPLLSLGATYPPPFKFPRSWLADGLALGLETWPRSCVWQVEDIVFAGRGTRRCVWAQASRMYRRGIRGPWRSQCTRALHYYIIVWLRAETKRLAPQAHWGGVAVNYVQKRGVLIVVTCLDSEKHKLTLHGKRSIRVHLM